MKTWSDFGIDTKGKISGDVRTTCPQCSAHRKKKSYPCLHVDLDKGVWFCHHCNWAGTIKGGQWQRPEIEKVYAKPTYVKPQSISTVVDWFATRGIRQEVVERNHIGKGTAYFPQTEEEMPCLLFPYYRGEEVVNIKYRTRDKLFRMAAGAERVLYGLNDIAQTLIWTEGEVDKLSIEMAGYTSCVSVPDGAPAVDSKNYSSKFEYLKEEALTNVKTHIIAVDNDAPGVRLQEELVRRLGCEKCLVVTWPDGCKDANDVLLKHGAAFLAECLAHAVPLPIEGTHKAGDLVDQLRNEYVHGTQKGLSTGWHTLDGFYHVMPGEWTVVTGIPGHGKSEWLDALVVNLAMREGWTFGVFSPENQPLTYHIQKLAEKYIGKPFNPGPNERINQKEFGDAIQWIDQHFTFILPELPTVEKLLEIATQLVLRNGIRGFIIDPWNEIDHSRANSMNETEHISQMLTKVRAFARNHGVHVWLVAHPTKLHKGEGGNYPVPTPYDISGSAHWRNKADNCITIFRSLEENDDRVEIHIQKIRKKMNGKIGTVPLIYNRIVGQYRDDLNIIPGEFARKHREVVKEEF